jgi:hypothetical protein
MNCVPLHYNLLSWKTVHDQTCCSPIKALQFSAINMQATHFTASQDIQTTYTMVTQLVKSQFVCKLSSTHSIRQVLLVSKHQQYCISQLVLLQLHTVIFATKQNVQHTAKNTDIAHGPNADLQILLWSMSLLPELCLICDLLIIKTIILDIIHQLWFFQTQKISKLCLFL